MASINETVPYRALESEFVLIDDSRNLKPSVYMSSSYITLGNDRKIGQTLPGWRDRVAKKLDASTPYTRIIVDYDGPAKVKVETLGVSPPLNYKLKSTGAWTLVGAINPMYTTDTETYNRALARIKRMLSSRTGNMAAMAPLAEVRELGGLVRQMTYLGLEFTKAVLDAKRSKGRSVWNELGDLWLGFNFGLRPLVADVGNLGNAIASYIARNDLSERLAATASKVGQYNYTPSSSFPGMLPIGVQSVEKRASAQYNLSYRFVGGFDVALRSSNQYSMLDHLGLGLSQIPATLWELTAFSWMYDYFTNIGDFLSDVFQSPPGQTRFLVCNRRYTLGVQHSFRCIPGTITSTGCITTKNIPGYCNLKYVEFQRTPLSQLPHAGLYIKSFDSQAAFGVSKLLNLVSVIKTKYRSDLWTRE